jgi:hypothetical protein
MLKRITIGVLAIMMILAVGCGNTSDSLKEEDGVAQDRVAVRFNSSAEDGQVSDLLESLGSHLIGEHWNQCPPPLVSVPEEKSPADMVEALSKSPLVERAELYYLFDPDEAVVKFKVAVSDSRVSDLLESLGSHITQSYEGSDFVLVSVPEDRTVAEIVDALSSSPLVEYAEPDYYLYY